MTLLNFRFKGYNPLMFLAPTYNFIDRSEYLVLPEFFFKLLLDIALSCCRFESNLLNRILLYFFNGYLKQIIGKQFVYAAINNILLFSFSMKTENCYC